MVQSDGTARRYFPFGNKGSLRVPRRDERHPQQEFGKSERVSHLRGSFPLQRMCQIDHTERDQGGGILFRCAPSTYLSPLPLHLLASLAYFSTSKKISTASSGRTLPQRRCSHWLACHTVSLCLRERASLSTLRSSNQQGSKTQRHQQRRRT